MGAYTTAVIAAGDNPDLLPVGVGWPGTLLVPYGRVDFTGGGAAATVSGVVAGLDGQIVIYRNTTAQDVTLLNESALSVAANRLSIGPGDLDLTPGTSVQAVYYAGVINRWIVQL